MYTKKMLNREFDSQISIIRPLHTRRESPFKRLEDKAYDTLPLEDVPLPIPQHIQKVSFGDEWD